MRSLYVKFTTMTIVIMLLSSIFAFMFSNFYYQQKLKPENDAKNTKIAYHIATSIEQDDTRQLEPFLEDIAAVGYHLFLTSEFGDEQFFGDEFRDTTLSEQVITDVLTGETYHGMANFPQETFVTGFFANELRNTIGVPFTHNETKYALFMRPNIKLLFSEMHILFAWMLGLTVLLSLIFVLLSARYLIRPISRLTAATEKIARGKFGIQLAVNRDDEIGTLAKSFTEMADQLAALDQMKNEFISNISHDIQSPLTNIKGYANLLESDKLLATERENYLKIINGEIDRLSMLTKQLLLLASLDQTDDLLDKEHVNIAEQIKSVVANYQWLIQEKEIMIRLNLPDTVINADRTMLFNVWENLLTNAIKYNKQQGEINISVTESDSYIDITFADTGIGITDEIKERLFERFYRGDTSRTKSVEGTGLGLAIVQSIVSLHGGTVFIESEVNKGSIFTITLPKASYK